MIIRPDACVYGGPEGWETFTGPFIADDDDPTVITDDM